MLLGAAVLLEHEFVLAQLKEDADLIRTGKVALRHIVPDALGGQHDPGKILPGLPQISGHHIQDQGHGGIYPAVALVYEYQELCDVLDGVCAALPFLLLRAAHGNGVVPAQGHQILHLCCNHVAQLFDGGDVKGNDLLTGDVGDGGVSVKEPAIVAAEILHGTQQNLQISGLIHMDGRLHLRLGCLVLLRHKGDVAL